MPKAERRERPSERVNAQAGTAETDAAPPTLRVGIGLLAVEAVGLLVVVIGLVIADLQAEGPSLRGGLLVTLYAAILTAILAGLGWALHRRRAWARGPAIVLQLLLLPISYYMITGGQAGLGVPLLIVGLVGAGTLVAPPTRAALGGR